MHRGKLLTEMVQRYRRAGFLLLTPEDRGALFADSTLGELHKACCEVIVRRGDKLVPKQDENMKQRLEMSSKLVNAPSAGQACDAAAGSEYKVKPDAKLKKRPMRMRMKLRNQSEVDKAYDRVTAVRRMAAQDGKISAATVKILEDAEKKLERNETTEAEVMKSFSSSSATSDFEAYRASGKLDRDIRKQQHLDDVFRFAENTVQSWNRTWVDAEALRQLLVGAVGAPLGELCGSLSGSVVMRLYDDSVLRLPLMSNCPPVHFHGAFTNFRDPRGLDVLVALPFQQTRHPPASVVVYPGSHHAIAQLTSEGSDVAAFQKTSLWDIGEAIRSFPALLQTAEPEVLVLEPGSVLIANNLLLRSCLPTMEGLMGEHTSLAPRQLQEPEHSSHIDDCPLLYMVQLMPDGAVFDGSRLSWMSKDTHGPLHPYRKGDPIRNNVEFPIIHNDLGVE